MKSFQWLLAASLLFIAQAAWAEVATVFSLTGNAQAGSAAGATRALRVGGELNQGETVTTGENSTMVIRFLDGQIVALTPKSRFAITTYTYNKAEPSRSAVLLSLLDGGMRAITGLIGKGNSSAVNYRASHATIGIRGTDTTIAVSGGQVAVTVAEGAITFSFGGQSVSIAVGQGAVTTATGAVQSLTAAQVLAALRAQDTAAAREMAAHLQTAISQDIRNAITRAIQAATPSSSSTPATTTPTPSSTSNTGTRGSTGAGGGAASAR